MNAPSKILAELWQDVGGEAAELGAVSLTGIEPALPSSFAVGSAAQVSIAAVGLAAAELWRLRTGNRQRVAVDMRHAAAEFRSERLLSVNGQPARGFRDPLAGIYRCRDGGWARPHLTFPHHRDGILRLLKCDPAGTDKDVLRDAFSRWDAETLEADAAAAGLPLAALRSFKEWDAHRQAAVIAGMPLVDIKRIGDAPPEGARSHGDRPLSGVRVLELARIIAGPVCGRALAAHGADVLAVSAPHLPSVHQLAADMGRGKLSCFVDLRTSEGNSRLRSLIGGADVFVQAYRPGALAALGYGSDAVPAVRPGIVYAELSAWGWDGPWDGRRGYDSLVQTASGFNHAEAEMAGEDVPRELPAQALDHASGYLMALGIMRTLARRADEGGSWRVRVCLARVGLWLRSLGRLQNGFSIIDPEAAEMADLMEESASGFGRLNAVRHAARLSETPARWIQPSVPLGTDPPVWPKL